MIKYVASDDSISDKKAQLMRSKKAYTRDTHRWSESKMGSSEPLKERGDFKIRPSLFPLEQGWHTG
jgi:hypothetical protein